MADGIAGNPTTLTGGSTGLIGNIRSITLPNMERVYFDTSSMSSTNDYRTFLGGMIDAGEATFELVFDKADVATLHAAIEAVLETWTIVFSNASTWACSGGVKSSGAGSANIDDVVTWNLTLKFSGKPTFVAGV